VDDNAKDIIWKKAAGYLTVRAPFSPQHNLSIPKAAL